MRIALRARIRKRLRTVLGRLLGLLFVEKLSNDPIVEKQLHRILLVRTNHRIGNLLFLTPLLRALHDRLPDCRIDLLIGLQAADSLFQPLPGIGRVYVIPKPAMTTLPQIIQLLRRLRHNNYDLSIDPNGKSASGRLVMALLRSQWKLGFKVEGSWSPLTHSTPLPREILHEARRPLLLLSSLQGAEQIDPVATLQLALSEEEKRQGAQILQSSLATQRLQGHDTPVLGLFRFARRDKRIADQWWLSWIHEFRLLAPHIHILEVLSPDASGPLLKGSAIVQITNLRLLSAVLSQLDAFICADTGPMHLASAAGAPTIALFNTTAPDQYGPVGEQDMVLQQPQHSVSALARVVCNHMQKIRLLHGDTDTRSSEGLQP